MSWPQKSLDDFAASPSRQMRVSLLDSGALKILEEAETICSRQSELYEAICHPFPNEDIDHIQKTVTSRKIMVRRLIKKGFKLEPRFV